MRGAGSGQNPPGPAPYIKALNPDFLHFLSSTLSLPLFFSVSLFVLRWNPNPNFVRTTQKCRIHGSKASSYCSNHESVTGIHMHWLNHRRSRILVYGFQSVLWFFLGSNLCSDETSHGFIGLQRLIYVVNPKILYGFEKNVRVSFFLNRTFWTPMDLRWFGLVWCSCVWKR